MRLLLDTHTLIWCYDGGSRLSPAALDILKDGAHEVYFSLASAWEMAIKVALGKLRLKVGTAELFREATEKYQFLPLPISLQDCLGVENLSPHHGDPFDRLLVSQCQHHQLRLISRDPIFDAYGVKRIW
ncbi:MAG: type II toxin-antitoxin system VapC family toxin [Candidatus Eremiobacteraeota bacterium]|nr:type II toxin-antitoxin system VapC family toxin [Candidatus Eremiobacteraeota bacterium]MCW5866536.1 type II toxin-antitoxin system VapC family toxin [Candidatus Eremiobacteraeota bacterium]